jgi:hypothetical protein
MDVGQGVACTDKTGLDRSHSWLPGYWIATGPRQHSDSLFRATRDSDDNSLSEGSGSLETGSWLALAVGPVYCCWFSAAQLCLVPNPEVLVTIFYCLTSLGVPCIVGVSPQLILVCRWYALLLTRSVNTQLALCEWGSAPLDDLVGGRLRWPGDL